MKKISVLFYIMVLVACYATPAYAALTTIGQAEYFGNSYNLIWDNQSPFGSIVWLDYTNSADTWANQIGWASGLSGVLTYNIDPGYSVTWSGDWRLPSTVDGPWVEGYDGTTTGGFNITSSELGHLFYSELGNLGEYATSGASQPGYGLTRTGPFDNLINRVYYSGTEYVAAPNRAWALNFVNGFQFSPIRDSNYVALAVKPADVTFSAVPEPGMLLLFGAGLAGLGTMRKRFKV